MGPVAAENLSLAKGRASDDAQVTLMDQSSDLCLSKICDCMAIEEEPSSPARDIRQKDLDDETEEGFANLGRIRLDEIHRDMSPGLPDLLDEEEDELDSQEVEALLADESMSDSSSMYDYDLSDEGQYLLMPLIMTMILNTYTHSQTWIAPHEVLDR